MKSITFLIALIIAAVSFSSNSSAEDAVTEVTKPTAVVFFSQNCGSCKVLDPRMKEALSQIKEDSIDVVVFDFSNKEAINNTKIMAKEKGLDEVLQAYGARTGFIALLDKHGNITDKINISHDVSDITSKLNALI